MADEWLLKKINEYEWVKIHDDLKSFWKLDVQGIGVLTVVEDMEPDGRSESGYKDLEGRLWVVVVGFDIREYDLTLGDSIEKIKRHAGAYLDTANLSFPIELIPNP